MRRILFVDDEPNLLDGLRRMLRSLRHEWSVEFMSSADEALHVLAQRPFDVLVTGMRMPGMDGAELLAEVRDRYPDVVRIVLSEQGDRQSILRSVRLTHQYLAKPCDAETLKAVVVRACALRDLLANGSLQQLISRLDHIPSVPALYTELETELETSDPSLRKVGDIIARDAGMAAKILQMVNSAFFGIPCGVSDPAQAVILLGSDTIKALVLTAQIFSRLEQAAVRTIDIHALWLHSQQTSGLARRIALAEHCERKIVDQACTSGLLHDTGKLVLAAHLPELYARVCAVVQEQELPLCDAEQEVLGSTHAEVAAYLFGLWGLPGAIVEAVGWHHRPSDCPTQQFGPLTAVHLANALVHEHAASRLDTDYIARLGLLERLPVWRALHTESR